MFHMDVYIAIDKHQKYMHIYTHIFTIFLHAIIVSELLLLLFVSFISKHNVAHVYPSDLVKHSKFDPTSSAVLAYLQIRKKLPLLA